MSTSVSSFSRRILFCFYYCISIGLCYVKCPFLFFRTKTLIMEIVASKGNPYGNPWTKLKHKS